MPRGDRTGPEGFGSRTGRGAGFCSGYGRPGYMNPMYGGGGFGPRGLGLGRGFRRFAGRGYGWYGADAYPEYDQEPVDEKSYIEDEIAGAKRRLEALESRLNALSKKES